MMRAEQRLGLVEDHLVATPEGDLLHPAAAQAFAEMQDAASAAGVNLAIASGFRSFERQRIIWNRKWCGERAINDKQGRPLDPADLSDEQKLHAILHWSALPGASRHHWGTDIDIWDPSGFGNNQQLQLIPEEYERPGAPCYTLWCWLKAHAEEYGFFFPYEVYQGGVAREPWHLSYRPIAHSIQHALTLEELTQAIKTADVEGKVTILEHLGAIKQRYFDTICGENIGDK